MVSGAMVSSIEVESRCGPLRADMLGSFLRHEAGVYPPLGHLSLRMTSTQPPAF